MRSQSLLLTALQGFNRPTSRHSLFKCDMFRVMEIEYLHLIQPKQAQATLHTATYLRPSEFTCAQIAIRFGTQNKARWKPPQLTQHNTYTALTLTIAIGSCGIDKSNRAGKDRADCGERLLFRHTIGERFRHITQGSTTNAKGGNC